MHLLWVGEGRVFDEVQSRRPSWTGPVVVLALVAGAGAYAWQLGVFDPPRSLAPTGGLPEPTRIEQSVAAMIAQPRFYGDRLTEQMLGEIELDIYQIDDGELYLSLVRKDRDDASLQHVLATHLDDPDAIEVATEDSEGTLTLGERSRLGRPSERLWFRTSIANLRAPADREVTFSVGELDYTPTLWELTSFLTNQSVLGGPRGFEPREGFVYANHAPLVAKPDEPSLTRFARALTAEATTREERVQTVLDFVSQDVSYSHREAVGSRETLKRPSEVLVTGTGDCSNKTVLTASLLHQLGEEVLFAYADEHIAPAVPRGDFPADNELTVTHQGIEHVLLETTAPGFEIGRSRLVVGYTVRWVQALDDEALV
ncbi:MAG: transglutaminase-like domain-containing protein, partial [Myxococcota bacterium]